MMRVNVSPRQLREGKKTRCREFFQNDSLSGDILELGWVSMNRTYYSVSMTMRAVFAVPSSNSNTEIYILVSVVLQSYCRW